MAQDKEREVKLQFLGEAREYLDAIESDLLGIGTNGIDRQAMDAILRAAHSIKGGAAMMGFHSLSHLAHRLEDFFKVLKTGKAEVDGDLERLFLESLDRLRQVASFNHQGIDVDEAWLETNANPLIQQLHDRLGDPQPEDAAALLSEEAGEDMVALLFETEVEGCLQRLESVLENPEMPCLVEEFLITAQELEGLGQMLELNAFCSLCQSIVQYLEAQPENSEAIARLALQEWRRVQAMVEIGQKGAIPSELNLAKLDSLASTVSPAIALATEIAIENLDEFEPFEDASLDFLDTGSEESTILPESFEPIAHLDELSVEEEVSLSLDSLELPEILETDAIEAPQLETESSALDTDLVTEDFALDGQELLSSLSNIAIEPETPKTEVEIEKVAPSSATSHPPLASNLTEKVEESTIRVSVRQVDNLSNLFGELTIERNGLDLQLKRLRDLMGLLGRRLRTLEQSNFRLRNSYDQVAIQASSPLAPLVPQLTVGAVSPSDGDFDLLEMDRYSDLHLISQEIMETVVQLQEVNSDLNINLEDTERAARDLSRTSKLMQNSITQLRMRPISDLVGRFPRALREMELKYGKQVDLKIKGGSTLVDRTILESLNDPLMHLFRNAFDHGIEDGATRQTNGKSNKGTIEISAAYRGNQTVITIRDDGSGIDLEKVRAKALEMGLSESDLKVASKKDLLDLIFEPGFSTADKVTDLSGRGVGMDVVRTNLRAIRGEIQVDTTPGKGTTFTITVPFTLSVVRVLLVESGGMLLAFPNSVIEEMLRLQPDMILSAAGKEVLNWEGFMVPLVQLNKWFHFSHFHSLPNTESLPVINEPTVLMVAQGDDVVGIQVDRYWGEQEVTIRQVEGNLAMPPGFIGCTILGDGRVVPLVDAMSLLRWINNRGSHHAADLSEPLGELDSVANPSASSAPGMVSTQNTILVVDDSINVRRFVALTLEKAGYRVEQAKDGQDAIEKLQGGLAQIVRAVVSDIEMPRLDGYGFLSHVKSDPACQHIPVLMLTSRSGEKHRRIAMNLGATAYFAKPFKEQELLQTLKQVTQKGLVVSG